MYKILHFNLFLLTHETLSLRDTSLFSLLLSLQTSTLTAFLTCLPPSTNRHRPTPWQLFDRGLPSVALVLRAWMIDRCQEGHGRREESPNTCIGCRTKAGECPRREKGSLRSLRLSFLYVGRSALLTLQNGGETWCA